MKVKAVKLGYYKHKRRYPGEVFELNDEKLFSQKWMKKVDIDGSDSDEDDEVVVKRPTKKRGQRVVEEVEQTSDDDVL